MCKEIDELHYIKNLTSKAVIFMTALFLFTSISCDESGEDKIGSEKDSVVSTRIYNAKFTLKDSGYDKVFLRSPIVEMYELIDTPFTVFPYGLELDFYKKGSKKPGFMRASYARVIEKKEWYEATGNVIVINEDGDSLKTQKLFWNRKTRQILSPDTTYVIRKDGSFLPANGGMTASEDFKTFEFRNNQGGRIFVKDKPSP